MKCIFCKTQTGTFINREHLVPDTLGGEIILPVGLVCDTCNQYFGRAVECFALETPILSFLRASLGIPNKRGIQKNFFGGQFAVMGQRLHESIFLFPPATYEHIMNTQGGTLYIPNQIGIGHICRLLLKMGLEYIAVSSDYDVFEEKYDGAREAARSPKKNATWPVAFGRLNADDIILEVGSDSEEDYREEVVYSLNLATDPSFNLIGFYFQYSWATFIVPLNSSDWNIFKSAIDSHNTTISSEYKFSTVSVNLTGRD